MGSTRRRTQQEPETPLALVVPKRRVVILLVAMLVVLGLVAARTVYVQSVENRMLTQYAHGQQQNTQTLPAVRGDILDRNGREFALGEDALTFYATPSLLKNRAGTALQIAKILGMGRAEADDLSNRLVEATGGFAYVKRQVSRDKAEALQDAKIPGIGSYPEEKRMYPGGPVAGSLIGRVNLDGVGSDGLEMLYDKSLTGQPGMQVAVNDPTGVPVDVLELRRERDGHDVQLTIDYVLQEAAERALAKTKLRTGAESASAIVLNPRTGEILAMAQNPRVNPSSWATAPAVAKRNINVTDTYEPGSTFKVVAISAAIEEGLVTPSTSFVLKPELRFCKEKTNCVVGESHKRGTKRMSVRDILVESSNVGTITIAQKIRQAAILQGKSGNEAVNDWIHRFGFGSLTNIDFPGEVAGIVRPAKDWSAVSIGNIPIGQGILVTPMQLAEAYAIIANDGVAIQPHLLKRIGDEPPATYPKRRVLSARTAAIMRSMFEGVVSRDDGTGRKAGIEGYEVGGKTGTAQVAGPSGYEDNQYTGSFVGFVPAKNPQLVTLVVVNKPTNGHYGGDVAAPAFEEITSLALKYLSIPPDGKL